MCRPTSSDITRTNRRQRAASAGLGDAVVHVVQVDRVVAALALVLDCREQQLRPSAGVTDRAVIRTAATSSAERTSTSCSRSHLVVLEREAGGAHDRGAVGGGDNQATAGTALGPDRAVVLEDAHGLAQDRPADVVALDQLGLGAEHGVDRPAGSLDVLAQCDRDPFRELGGAGIDLRRLPSGLRQVDPSAARATGVQQPFDAIDRAVHVAGLEACSASRA